MVHGRLRTMILCSVQCVKNSIMELDINLCCPLHTLVFWSAWLHSPLTIETKSDVCWALYRQLLYLIVCLTRATRNARRVVIAVNVVHVRRSGSIQPSWRFSLFACVRDFTFVVHTLRQDHKGTSPSILEDHSNSIAACSFDME